MFTIFSLAWLLMGVVKMMPWYINNFFWRVSADNVDITGNYNQLFCQPEAEAAYTILCIQFRKHWEFLRGFVFKANLIVSLCHDWTIQHHPGLKIEGGFAWMKRTMQSHSKPTLRYCLQPIAYNDQPQFLIVYSFLLIYLSHNKVQIYWGKAEWHLPLMHRK